jgi:hypothetical protein
MNRPKVEVPNPGSKEAIAAGCICPVLDNSHGRGYYGRADMFIYTVGCPVHAAQLKALETELEFKKDGERIDGNQG